MARPGFLRYRGYPIEELANRSTFLEVAWLLIHGELPSAKELKDLHARGHGTHCCTRTSGASSALAPMRHPMPVAARRDRRPGDVLPAAGDRADAARLGGAPDRQDADHRGVLYKHSIGQPFMYPLNKLGLRTRTSCT
jgi:citrate synthase